MYTKPGSTYWQEGTFVKGKYLMETVREQEQCDETVGDLYSETCPCREILDLVASKWSALIIGRLEEDTHRFGQLRRAIPGVTQKMLTQTLRRLEKDGLVHREVIPTRPPQVEYSLTDLGRSASSPLAAIRDWSEANLGAIKQARQQFAQLESQQQR